MTSVTNTDFWNSTTQTDWNNALNWSNGVPTTSSAVTIGANSYPIISTTAYSDSINLTSNITITWQGTLNVSSITGGTIYINGGVVNANDIGKTVIYTNIHNNSLINFNSTSNQTQFAIGGMATLTGNLSSTWINLYRNSTLTLNTSNIINSNISLDLYDKLIINNPANFKGFINGFQLTDKIDLVGVKAISASLNTDTLNIIKSDGSTLSYGVSIPYTGYVPKVMSDGNGGTFVYLQIPSTNNNLVTSGTVSTFLTNASSALLSSFNIIDSASNIISNLDLLNTNISKINSITSSTKLDVLPITLSQLYDDPLFSLINGNFTYSISNVDAYSFPGLLSSTITSVSIQDTSWGVSGIIDKLDSVKNNIAKITLTDNGNLHITADQQVKYQSILSKIEGGYTIDLNSTNLVNINSNLDYTALANQTITGLGKINTVYFNESSKNFSVFNTNTNTKVDDNLGLLGTELLLNIQRIKFNDGKSIALDLKPNQSGGQTAEILGAALGKSGILNKIFFGIGLNLFDSGMNIIDVCKLVIDAGLISPDNTNFVKIIWQNVTGTPIDSVNLSDYVNLLNNGTFTQTTLLSIAATSTFNQNNLNLVGLSQTGVEYLFQN